MRGAGGNTGPFSIALRGYGVQDQGVWLSAKARTRNSGSPRATLPVDCSRPLSVHRLY